MILEEDVEPPQKKTKLSPLHHELCQSSFSSLPEEIVVECLARISKSYYRSLSLVSKTFRSLISSQQLYAARSQTGTTEIFLCICLRFFTKPLEKPTRRWFSLSVKPNRNQTDGTKSKERSSENLFVPFYNSHPYSDSIVAVGSKIYIIGGHMCNDSAPSSALWVYDYRSRTRGDDPNMEMKRKHASACVLDDKIYVMGGCGEGINWFEMYDIKTQTWKTLPKNPDIEVRLGDRVRKIDVVGGKIYVKTVNYEPKDWIYDVKKGKWSVAEEQLSLLWSNSWCVIDNVMYCYSFTRYKWYDLEARKWRDVKGLEALKKYRSASNDSCTVVLVNYGGKLAILWDKFERPGRSQNKNIWCAMVALERCHGGAILGKIEWINVVLTVPMSYNFLSCIALSV